MQNLKHSRGVLFIYGSLVAASSALVLAKILSSPSEAERVVAFGLSAPRLVIALGLLLVFGLFARLALKAFRDQAWARQFIETWFGGKGLSDWTGWLIGIGFGLGWIGCFLPAYRLGAWSEYWVRVQPAMVLILFGSLATWIVFWVVRIKTLDTAPFRLGLPLFLISLLALGVMLYSGFGIIAPEDYWYGTGVPLLASQLLATLIGGVLLLRFGSGWISRRADVLICISIFAITSFLWAREPLRSSFLFTGPSLPSGEYYPFADATAFDIASQFAIIGQKLFIFNTLFFERPLYLSFLVYLHSFFGQDFEMLMAVQAALFAILPVLVYLIGRSLDARVVGFASALATILRGLNSISASNLIDTANPKMILTDFPTAIGIALVTLFLCEWMKAPERKQQYPIWVGGAIGFALMLRTNALILLAFIPLYIFFLFPTKWRQWVLSSLLVFLGAIAITLPWEIRNQALGGQMYGPIVAKFRSVIEQRYPQFNSSTPLERGTASVTLRSTQIVSVIHQGTGALQNAQPCNTLLCFSTNHFLHNVITSLLALPTSPYFDELRYLIKERSPGYWNGGWDGSFTPSAAFFLSLNLFFTTLGISVAWKEKRLPGLAPLAIFVAYNISNGLARTSGGRYLVPADWILLLYYMIGMFYVLTWGVNQLGIRWNLFSSPHKVETSNRETISAKALGAFATLFLLGGLIPLAENLHLPRYQNLNPLEMLAENRPRIEETGMKVYELDTFLQSPGANILVGRALYPRYYKMNQGEIGAHFYPYLLMGFPRTAFKLIGPAGESSIILSGLTPAKIPHAGDLLVLGCNEENYFDALAVIPLDKNGEIYVRHPQAPLQCPMPEPVCNNNSVCR